MNRSLPSFYVVAGLVVGAVCGYGAATVQAVSDLRILNQWDIAYAYNYEGFNSAYVVACVAAGFASFAAFCYHRSASNAVTGGVAAETGLEGLDEFIERAETEKSTRQEAVPV